MHVDDPRTLNKDVYITTNVLSQEELIQQWKKISGKHVKRIPVSPEDLEKIIAISTTPDTFVNMIFAQLARSVWIRGDATKRSEGGLEATELYPQIDFSSVNEGLTRFIT